MPTHDRSPALALLFMRVTAALLLLQVHGLPKLLHWQSELQHIEDPFGLGAVPTLALAVFAEVLCPILLILGVFARLACLPVIAVLLVALLFVHPQWSLEEGQFAWWMLILFTGLAIAGPGAYRLPLPRFVTALMEPRP
ncbi:DoxX family protein [Pseudomonas nicosulfuronedens]|uniref:DoxX family protein n=1 Tax=Pseudomonas nicosulfuronedens TaxID=2571105 RepID=A0A5R9QUV4_9PSED|nr:DoxX family protein [Pseudomonas nicosulfuronedens]MDH1012579.1 DoxX family protein [Pseudomonas nicosulfuronedens]MDH1982509.1 DoxX family protein [Pseudomonas nicosulfuronedens]MDH2029422.1 DoxX family protein [Pseudomonas nicosulfuronedens]TLX73123.1 DoxX family protein [Pseudomonas nicosulfuronedens]